MISSNRRQGQALGLLAAFLSLTTMAVYARIAEPTLKKKPSDQDMPFYTVAKGTKSGIKSSERFAIRDEDEWLSLWRRHKRGSMTPEVAPPLDFDEQMVVAVFQGEGTHDCGLIEIDRIRSLPDQVLVTLREGDAPGGGQSQGEKTTTSCFHIVKTARNELPVTFQ